MTLDRRNRQLVKHDLTVIDAPQANGPTRIILELDVGIALCLTIVEALIGRPQRQGEVVLILPLATLSRMSVPVRVRGQAQRYWLYRYRFRLSNHRRSHYLNRDYAL